MQDRVQVGANTVNPGYEQFTAEVAQAQAEAESAAAQERDRAWVDALGPVKGRDLG
jgi:hypothetical protein